MRLRAKVDANQREIVEALRKAGCSVQTLAAVGAGVPDLLVGFRGQTYLIEVKDPAKPPSHRRLTDKQVAWHGSWQGDPVQIVKSPEEALVAVGLTLFGASLVAATAPRSASGATAPSPARSRPRGSTGGRSRRNS